MTAPAHRPRGTARGTGGLRDGLRAWAELLRVSALPTVPGDALAGAAVLGRRPDRGTLLALAASLCLYTAGMALNDWADRDEDARDRPERPLPSGRIRPAAALTAATALTGTGLALASRAGRPALTVATALATTAWAYDLRLKHTPLGPAAMATVRALDLLLGAAATRDPAPGRPPRGLPGDALSAALALGAHTYGITTVSRHEAHGGSTRAPLTALTTTLALTAFAARTPAAPGARVLNSALAASYLRTAATPLLHAALHPTPPLTRRAVGAGIRALVPLQAALAARRATPAGTATALAVLTLAPAARALARKVSPT
ncbi:SCO3242 family prenyltransferase [Streptomyces sp. NPDC000594]|uniref:SCO3242 family prenyltransferase n=1 Tax=Streptomyces sp. NPDC000594 TaxID=3154261 RepID=UPI00332AEAA9